MSTPQQRAHYAGELILEHVTAMVDAGRPLDTQILYGLGAALNAARAEILTARQLDRLLNEDPPITDIRIPPITQEPPWSK